MFLSDYAFTEMPPMSRNYSFIIILVYLVVAILSFIRVLQSNAQISETNRKLENQLLTHKLEFKTQELAYLKKQIHPHFLFNTLNSIYGHALKSSNETPGLIIKLSNLLDYILYQVDKPQVLLSQEIAHIQEYISLEEIRQSDELLLTFNKEIDQDIEIPPMLLLPFIENCFKHGRPIDGIFSIGILLQASHGFLDLKISNSCMQTSRIAAGSGIGLDNIQRRLNILYPNKHELTCTHNPAEYKVHLHINFSNVG
ncbi:MAG: two-component system LytT family sensor kinase [Saprospiraceae bacterium]|jgi:two-component system LytT family sensor kinase